MIECEHVYKDFGDPGYEEYMCEKCMAHAPASHPLYYPKFNTAKTMRELVIDELVYRRNNIAHEPDFSNGLEVANKIRQEQDQAYRETLVNVSDTDLLFDLLDIVNDIIKGRRSVDKIIQYGVAA